MFIQILMQISNDTGYIHKASLPTMDSDWINNIQDYFQKDSKKDAIRFDLMNNNESEVEFTML